MFSYILSALHRFFERNLFERLIIYIFLSFLITKIVFEFLLGEHYFIQSQHRQWIFYSLLGLDYLISFKKVINTRITLNPISLFSLCLFIMVAHGLFVGIINNNAAFVILNDTIPPLMIGLNILRMQSFSEISKPIDFNFLFLSCVSMAVGICFFGFLAGKMAIGDATIFFPLVIAAFIKTKPFPKWIAATVAVLVLLTIDDINRTTMVFILLIASSYIAITSLYNPARGLILVIITIIGTLSMWSFLPEASKTYQRIVALTKIDLNERTGSIGERQAENDAIHTMLEKKGVTAQWVGAGFGGLYSAQFTHEYKEDYGHAHYIWAWFNLRFGKIGYFYMLILLSALAYNGVRSLRQNTDIGLFVSFLCLLGFIYAFTYVNAIFLLSGLQFLYTHPPLKQRSQRE